MKISRLTLWSINLTSHEPYYMADGKTCATVQSHILCLETDTGLKGWGEVCPIPHYLPAYARGVPSAIEELAPEILGASPCGVDHLMRRLDAHLQGHAYAKSIVDIALWDLFGQAVGVPLYDLLGGRVQRDLPLYHSITCVAPDDMARIVLILVSQDPFQQRRFDSILAGCKPNTRFRRIILLLQTLTY